VIVTGSLLIAMPFNLFLNYIKPRINHLLCRQRAEARNLKTFVFKQVAYAGRYPPAPKGESEKMMKIAEMPTVAHKYPDEVSATQPRTYGAMKRLAGI